ncbi:DUF3667 domain-containing protein [Leeuwenhoekiella parthenopeia]|uniref:DUF3667 domain-containing protein n=1 Tax=Leeuwenhoekiella parthenopeia TaxID=2890320 RepID=A0ABS8GR24_9FLAO|nr:DUF3667 domain-containing protein [Leeuwenhoekiella parthenopeia]MCC4212432.1 DUF3667 domain-containing protein [Leeuwenhoekiella parthenopeia]
MEQVEQTNEQLAIVSYCRNCHQNLDAGAAFCSACGGQIVKNRITVKNLAEDFNDRFLNLDSAFLKTFRALFTKPEDVIGGYIDGVRKKYLSAFGYFAISLTVAGIYVFILREYLMDSLFENLQVSETPNQEQQLAFIKNFTMSINEYQTLFSVLSIPILALISRIVFWNYKKYNYLEHIVIYLYAFSHINLVFYILAIGTIWSTSLYTFISFTGIIAYIVYICFVLKRLYRLNTTSLILKTSLFALIGGIVFTILCTVAMIIMYKLGVFDALIESTKTAGQSKS